MMIALIYSPFTCIKAFHETAERHERLTAFPLAEFVLQYSLIEACTVILYVCCMYFKLLVTLILTGRFEKRFMGELIYID